MAKNAAQTGLGPATVISIEQHFPKEQRILEDDFAELMLSTGLKTFVSLMRFSGLRQWLINKTERQIPGIWGSMLIRKRYIDDKARASIPDIEAVVNLGAGFDTRFFRVPEMKSLSVWELDQPVNISAKKSQIIKSLSAVPSNLHLAPIDFDRESIADALITAGYVSDTKTFFIWEGVTQYLTQEGIDSTMAFLSKAASGSKMAFTYVIGDFIQGKAIHDCEKAYEKYIVKEKMWLFGINPVELPDFLEKYGWKLVEDKDASELADVYIKPTGRKLVTTPIERMAFAEKV